MMVLVALFGGVALMLYGIRLTGDGLQRAAGNRLRTLLTGMSRNRFLAMASGATITGDGRIALILDVPSMLKRYAARRS